MYKVTRHSSRASLDLSKTELSLASKKNVETFRGFIMNPFDLVSKKGHQLLESSRSLMSAQESMLLKATDSDSSIEHSIRESVTADYSSFPQSTKDCLAKQPKRAGVLFLKHKRAYMQFKKNGCDLSAMKFEKVSEYLAVKAKMKEKIAVSETEDEASEVEKISQSEPITIVLKKCECEISEERKESRSEEKAQVFSKPQKRLIDESCSKTLGLLKEYFSDYRQAKAELKATYEAEGKDLNVIDDKAIKEVLLFKRQRKKELEIQASQDYSGFPQSTRECLAKQPKRNGALFVKHKRNYLIMKKDGLDAGSMKPEDVEVYLAEKHRIKSRPKRKPLCIFVLSK